MNLIQVQKKVYENKIAKGFNVTDIYKEFCLLHVELTEALEAYMQNKDNIGEELADIAIYLLGLSEILGINLSHEIEKKINKNEKRQYIQKDGVNIRIDDGENTYICEHGYTHDYDRFNLEDYKKEMANAKTYTNLDEMWKELDSEDEDYDV